MDMLLQISKKSIRQKGIENNFNISLKIFLLLELMWQAYTGCLWTNVSYCEILVKALKFKFFLFQWVYELKMWCSFCALIPCVLPRKLLFMPWQ